MLKYRKAVFILVYAKTGKKVDYLLLKRRLHWKGWEFPKGGIEKGEKSINSAKRELKEETGLNALGIKKFRYSGKYKYNRKFSTRPGLSGQTFSLYAAKVRKGKVKADKKEHSGYKWADFNSSLKILSWPNQRESLKLVNSWLINEIQRNKA